MSVNIDRRTVTVYHDEPYAVIRLTDPIKRTWEAWTEAHLTETELERIITEANSVLKTMQKLRRRKPIPGQTTIEVSEPAEEGITT